LLQAPAAEEEGHSGHVPSAVLGVMIGGPVTPSRQRRFAMQQVQDVAVAIGKED
jgi:hypothetical protein